MMIPQAFNSFPRKISAHQGKILRRPINDRKKQKEPHSLVIKSSLGIFYIIENTFKFLARPSLVSNIRG